MKILFDQGTPAPLRSHLTPPIVDTAYERDWSSLTNGDLLAIAEAAGYSLMITTDQNLRYQQDISSRKIGILVLMTTSWPKIQKQISRVTAAVDSIKAGDYLEIRI